MTTDVLVLSVATEETAYFPALRASAESQGFRFEVLGMGRQWGGFIWANSLILERLWQCEPDQLVLVLDGYDTIITTHREYLVETYHKVCSLANERAGHTPTSPTGKWVVVAVEHPREESGWLYWNTIVRAAHRYHAVSYGVDAYLNTGAIMGPACHLVNYMKSTLQNSSATKSNDDQRVANALFWSSWVHTEEPRVSRREAPLPIALDTECDLFYCHCERRFWHLLVGLLWSPNNFQTPLGRVLALNKNGLWRKKTGTRVGVVHGIWNTNLDRICAYMGLPYDPKYHKEVSQPDIRVFARVARRLSLVLGAFLVVVAVLHAPL